MSHIFDLKDKTGRTIHLSQWQWTHIRREHPDVIDIEDITHTLTHPDKISPHANAKTIVDYFTYHRQNKLKLKYLKVIVKYLNGTGFVITAYFNRRMR